MHRVAKLQAAYPGASSAQLAAVDRGKTLTPEWKRRFQRLLERHSQFAAMFWQRYTATFPEPGRRVAIELGCGMGGGLIDLARRFDVVYGVDLSLPALVIANKLIEERDLHNVRLVRASAHALPFAAGSADYVSATNVLEHLYRPRHLFKEVHRILRPGGGFVGDSRNRFDPFFPEPHVKLMWVGFLPRKLMPRYVRLRTGRGYEGKYLLSYRQLRRAITASFGNSAHIILPDLRPYRPTVPLAIETIVQRIRGNRPLQHALLHIAPTHLAVAYKAAI